MTLYMIGLVVLRLLCSAIFFLGLYKLLVLAHNKIGKNHRTAENRGIIILKERFASGEIDEANFRTMSAEIKS